MNKLATYRDMSKKARVRSTLLLIIVATIPCYCMGVIVLKLGQVARQLPTITLTQAEPLTTATLSPSSFVIISTQTPSVVPSQTWTPTLTKTQFIPPTRTSTITETSSPVPTSTFTSTATITETVTLPPTDTVVVETETLSPSETATLTETPTETETLIP